MAHTPGPWDVDGVNITAKCGQVICETFSVEADYEKRFYPTADANARLIAAAPDLLKALGNLLAIINRDSDGSFFICEEAEGILFEAWATYNKL